MTEARAQAAEKTRAGGPPDVIYLPDQSQPAPGKTRGRHFGSRRVADPKDCVITFRCTAAEHALIAGRAAEKGLDIGPYLRARETGSPGPRTRRKPGADATLLAKVLAQMGKAGSNLNQIAHRLNEYDFEGIPELQAMRAEHQGAIAEHRAVCAAILKALGV